MLEVTIKVTGKSLSDVEYGIKEARRRIMQSNTSGFDSNEDGDFEFEVTGKEEGEFNVDDNVRLNDESPPVTSIFEDGLTLPPGSEGVVIKFDADNWNYEVNFGEEIGIWTVGEMYLEKVES